MTTKTTTMTTENILARNEVADRRPPHPPLAPNPRRRHPEAEAAAEETAAEAEATATKPEVAPEEALGEEEALHAEVAPEEAPEKRLPSPFGLLFCLKQRI